MPPRGGLSHTPLPKICSLDLKNWYYIHGDKTLKLFVDGQVSGCHQPQAVIN